MVGMTHPLTRMSSKVMQKDFNNRFEIMEDQGHSPLKSGSSVFKAERHLPICKGTPRTNKGSLMLVLEFDFYLIDPENPSIKENTLLPAHSSKI